MSKINIEIVKKIKIKRHEIGYKQESLAIEFGISQSALSRIENVSDSLVVEILYLLTQVLNTPIGYFISDINGDLFTAIYLEKIKLLEEMLLKNETLINHQVKVIKQLEDQIKDLQEKVSRKNKKIEELKETISHKKI